MPLEKTLIKSQSVPHPTTASVLNKVVDELLNKYEKISEKVQEIKEILQAVLEKTDTFEEESEEEEPAPKRQKDEGNTMAG